METESLFTCLGLEPVESSSHFYPHLSKINL